jgi:iron(III) transport system substrate-binding protein
MTIIFLFLLILLSPTAGLTQIDPQLVESAKKEGELVFYSASNTEDVRSLADGFRKLYPFINVNSYRSGDYALLTRVRTEAKGGLYAWDVIDITTYPGYWLAKDGFFAKYAAPERKYIRDGHLDDQSYWTSMLSAVNVVVYNSKLVTKENLPKRYEDLLDPKWTGKMGMEKYAYEWFANVLHVMGEERGRAFMKKLGEQKIAYRGGRTLNTELLAAGEFPLGIALYLHRARDMKNKGAPIDWVMLEPAVANLHPVGLSAKAPHPNAGKLFIRYLLSQPVQESLAKTGQLPARKGEYAGLKEILRGVEPYPSQPKLAERLNENMELYKKLLQVP